MANIHGGIPRSGGTVEESGPHHRECEALQGLNHQAFEGDIADGARVTTEYGGRHQTVLGGGVAEEDVTGT